MSGKRLHLEGKDWFTEAEAAEYCGVALSTFREGYRTLGIVPRRFLGKKLYSRADLFAAIDRSPAWEATPRLTGNASKLLTNLRPVRQHPYKPRKSAQQSVDELMQGDPTLAHRLTGVRLRPYKPRKVKRPISEG